MDPDTMDAGTLDAGTTGISTAPRVEGLQVVVRDGTPFLPKVAFGLITLASMAGVTLTSSGMGLTWWATAVRWLALWSLALAGGFLGWRVAYLRAHEHDVDEAEALALHDGQLAHAGPVGRWVALAVALGAPGALVLPTVAGQPWLQVALVAGPVLVALLLLPGMARRATTLPAAALVLLLLVGWAWADAAPGWPFVLRALHLVAFALWIGGALWNITVAMPAGREHPTVDAVLAGARQLDRFRWVVRLSLPTIIVTGLLMAGAYRALPLSWWVGFPGVLILVKVLAIVALVVVFITCPLFRHCSPVQGVCDIEDLDRP